MYSVFLPGRKDRKLRRVENIPTNIEDNMGNLIPLPATHINNRLLVRRYPHPTDTDQSIVDILVDENRLIKADDVEAAQG